MITFDASAMMMPRVSVVSATLDRGQTRHALELGTNSVLIRLARFDQIDLGTTSSNNWRSNVPTLKATRGWSSVWLRSYKPFRTNFTLPVHSFCFSKAISGRCYDNLCTCRMVYWMRRCAWAGDRSFAWADSTSTGPPLTGRRWDTNTTPFCEQRTSSLDSIRINPSSVHLHAAHHPLGR